MFILFFARIRKVPQLIHVDRLAGMSFGVYLLHTQPLVFNRIIKDSFTSFCQLPVGLFLLSLCGTTIGIFSVCIFIKYLRVKAFHIIGIREKIISLEKKVYLPF